MSSETGQVRRAYEEVATCSSSQASRRVRDLPRSGIAPQAGSCPGLTMDGSPPVTERRGYFGRDARTALHACSQRRHASRHVWQ